jgi:hypothetical protein
MTAETDQLNVDRDSLHILPLATVPLHIPSLQKARLIKNARLEGMVELYSGKDIGSGQIHASALDKSFDFSGEKANDLSVVRSLCKLPSFDVYSMRLGLRKLGIDVDEHEHLRLSEPMKAKLSDYMPVFTRPLITVVYGDSAATSAGSYQDMLKLVIAPDQGVAMKNLNNLAKMLEIPILEIPSFLQDYADVYLSLAYYQFCVDNYLETMTEFFEWLHELRQDPGARTNGNFVTASKNVEHIVMSTTTEVQHVLGMFENRTANMWDKPSAKKFRAMKRLIIETQSQIGGALCAVTVKLDAWAQKFRSKGPGGIQQRIEFIMSEMRYGLDQIQPIRYSDEPQ